MQTATIPVESTVAKKFHALSAEQQHSLVHIIETCIARAQQNDDFLKKAEHLFDTQETTQSDAEPDWKQAIQQLQGAWKDRDDVPDIDAMRREADDRIPR